MLNETRVSDGGIYRCMVNNPPDTADPGVGELLLSVLGRWLTCCLFHLIKKKIIYLFIVFIVISILFIDKIFIWIEKRYLFICSHTGLCFLVIFKGLFN